MFVSIKKIKYLKLLIKKELGDTS